MAVGCTDGFGEGQDTFISLGKGVSRAGKLGNYFTDEHTRSTLQKIY